MRLNLSDAVDDLAPDPPPCYHNRTEWIAYLKSAASAQNQRDEPKVILITIHGEPTFNRQFPYCTDCNPEHRERMQSHSPSRCQPNYLRGPSCPPTPQEPSTTNFKEQSTLFDQSSKKSDPPPQDRSKHTQKSSRRAEVPKPKPEDLSSVFARWVK